MDFQLMISDQGQKRQMILLQMIKNGNATSQVKTFKLMLQIVYIWQNADSLCRQKGDHL